MSDADRSAHLKYHYSFLIVIFGYMCVPREVVISAYDQFLGMKSRDLFFKL